MKPTREFPFIIIFISIIIGFMLSVQYKSYNTSATPEAKDISQLRQDLQKEMERHQRILTEISKYDQLLYEYENPLNQADSLKVMKEELSRIKVFAGLSSLEGRGLSIKIEELPSFSSDQEISSLTQIFDDDIRYIVNELFGAGAQAISINGNRMTPTTSIRNVGNDIQVDTKVIKLPYDIRVIGDPEVLESALKLKGFEEYFNIINKKITMKKLDKLLIPAYDGKGMIRYMKPLKEGS
ncbi:DUF881 domain-containing protein [Ammoniphilus sp. CFH 90114]|uniref:DUF881 domain-containing protein n=1 Tax=Ammoniphilus sp. CFH 90114 TaxID=2493665 RepID=UPI00100F5D9E|nr:DUF881 domain-containing protein [Ammoniphilus sp. CFH 90114]RXT15011.1 DUF881 domain-containing protein [Ammoniphilus sp. CFH 90114]